MIPAQMKEPKQVERIAREEFEKRLDNIDHIYDDFGNMYLKHDEVDSLIVDILEQLEANMKEISK